jgi:ribonuclease HII
MILGIDEAGRGPWAGPLVVGAVVLGGVEIEGLTDSKKLTKKKREVLYDEIVEKSAAYASGWVSARELDEVGMSAALRLATRRAVEQIAVPYSEIIIDGAINFLAETSKGAYVQTMPKADLLVPSVSAASIIAKVERDRYMTKLGEEYPEYDFSSHAGYGVAKHREAIDRLGVTPEHRLSFAPLKKYAVQSEAPEEELASISTTTTKAIGDTAEEVVATYLRNEKHEIIERNWRTKFCEIDIISRHGNVLYFTEVKYRKNANQGGGMAAITSKKLRQMTFAAELYMMRQKESLQPMLAAASVVGPGYDLEDWLLIK